MNLSERMRAFTLSEVVIALGLIGILCVTMLSLNSMSDNNYKVASTKLAQVDSAIKSWGKAISKSNETGLGALQTVTSQKALEDSLGNYMNTQRVGTYDENATVNIKDENGGIDKDYSGYTEMTLNNGVTLKVKYIDDRAGESAGDVTYERNNNDSLIAVVRAEVEVKGKNEVLDEQYILTATGVESVDSLYDGWDKYNYVEDVDVIGEDGKPTGEKIGNFCIKDTTKCITSPTDEKTIFVKVKSTIACGSGKTGTIVTSTIGTAMGTYDAEINTCCPAPKVKTSQNAICKCPTTFIASAGYKLDEDSPECQTQVTAGAYALDGRQLLCGHTLVKKGEDFEDVAPKKGFYCPNDGMTESKECPAGYYCPNYSPDKIEKKYHDDIFPDKAKKDKYEKGGLKDKEPCPKGSYCPAGSVDHKICPKGSYCPAGSGEDTKCPAGTYNDQEGRGDVSECTKCPEGTYNDQEGQTDKSSCKPCDIEKGQYAKSGSTGCSVCPAGTIIQIVKGEPTCVACPAGTYKAEAGKTNECTPCEKDTYQPQTGQTECLKCPEHSSLPAGVTGATSIAQCKCDGGWGVDEAGSDLNGANFCSPAPIGTYSPDGDNTIFKCPPNSTTEKTNSEKIEQCLCNAGYAVNAAGTLQDEAGKYRCKAINDKTHYSGALDNKLYSCPSHSKTKQTMSEKIEQCLCDKGYGTNATGTLQDKKGTYRCDEVGIGNYSGDLDNKVYSCPDHSSTEGTTSEKIQQCLCDEGWGVDAAGTLQDIAGVYRCKEAVIGQWSPILDNHLNACVNSSTKEKRSVSITQCLCNAGYYTDTKGTLLTLDGSVKCRPINDKTHYSGELDNKIYSCPSNSRTEATMSSALSQCLCEEGYYGTKLTSDKKLQSESTCSKCSAGTYDNTLGNLACKNCECNKYQDLTGQTSCKNVAAGKYPAVQNPDKTFKHVTSAATSQQACPKGHKCPTNNSTCNLP
ncbi:MAG: hypothetical protein K6A44_03505, partial [bacterium]|nr:hypothetical protein [bacterium]